MSSIQRSLTRPLGWPLVLVIIAAATVCFHAAYLVNLFPYEPKLFGQFLILGYLIFLVQLARLKTSRQSFYAGLATGFLCVAPQLTCFWNIFGPGAIVLWIILAFWIGAFTGLTHAALERFGPVWTLLLIPFFWMGLEYFRSELYYLKFSWLNVGYAGNGDFQIFQINSFGMYGVGFLIALCAAQFLVFRRYMACGTTVVTVLTVNILAGIAAIRAPDVRQYYPDVCIAGVQMEFPNERDIPPALDAALAHYKYADMFVLSEYTLNGPVPDSLKDWCRTRHRYLVVGGKDPAPKNNFYDTAFVVGPDGKIVFRQVKSVPIQFFKDGLPAPEQKVWDSPWGKIGFCVCYDLSYTRVTDELVKQGAQMIIVPTMDVAEWGEHQHKLHALVAPVRAAEYGIPIFRVASSGISQAVDKHGRTVATAPFPGEGETLAGGFPLKVFHGSLPMDRSVAPFAVGITGVLFVFFCLTKKKAVPPIIEDYNAGTGKSESSAGKKSVQPMIPS